MVCLKLPLETLWEGVTMGVVQEEESALGQRGHRAGVHPLETNGYRQHLHASVSRQAAEPPLHFLPHSLGRSGSPALPAPPLTFRQHLPALRTRWLVCRSYALIGQSRSSGQGRLCSGK